MALTDKEKLRMFQRAVNLYVDSIATWPDALAIIAGMTKAKFKNFIMAKMDEAEAAETADATAHTDIAAEKTQRATDIIALKSEVDLT